MVDGADEVRALLSAAGQDTLGTVVQVPGFESRILVLHAMWEHPQGPGATSFDSVHRAAIAAGEIAPDIVGDVDLSEMGVATGIPIGGPARPAGWTRLRWSELAARWGVELMVDLSIDPLSCFRPHLVSGSWPIGIQPPPEGSLDWESLVRLVDLLGPSTGGQSVYNYSAPGAWYGPHSDSGSPPLAEGPLLSMLDLYREPESFGSGQNWWPADRSWLVHTDWDVSYSVIQGPSALLNGLLDDSVLETVRLDPL